ncbi:hypothetical protein BH24DEI2_BH24DEI2_25540 [soil metagenome]
MTYQDLANLFDLKGAFLGETLVELAYLRYQVLVPELATLKLAFADAADLLERPNVGVLYSAPGIPHSLFSTQSHQPGLYLSFGGGVF